MNAAELESIEVDLVVDAVLKRYGYDFRSYARASLTRRLRQHAVVLGLASISELVPRVLRNGDLFQQLLEDVSVRVTEFFRDPPFWRYVREHIVPFLHTYPFAKIWCAGCATGEEVYSLTILLKEEGYLDRCHVYATDLSLTALDTAKKGIYSEQTLATARRNHQQTGIDRSLDDDFFVRYESAKVDRSLAQNVTFAHHNLVTDGVFGEMNVIICRNVFIYFKRELQDRVLGTFYKSLCHRGYLCLGPRESIGKSEAARKFSADNADLRIFRRT